MNDTDQMDFYGSAKIKHLKSEIGYLRSSEILILKSMIINR